MIGHIVGGQKVLDRWWSRFCGWIKLCLPFVGCGLSLLMGPLRLEAKGFEEWLRQQAEVAFIKLKKNISPPEALRGVVLASPSRFAPDYYYHWTRDASLVMDTLLHLEAFRPQADDKQYILAALKDFALLSRYHQEQLGVTGLGEPKFYVDGRVFQGEWGRPQNDGPALRALVLSQVANQLLQAGEHAFVRQHLYDGRLPTASVIKRDLEYLSHSWQSPDFDLWEEVKGSHFFTRMLQRKALLTGAKLAVRLHDPGAAHWYRMQAYQLGYELEKHWSREQGFIKATINRVGGIDYKSHLDTSIVLGVIYGHIDDEPLFDYQDERVQATVGKLEDTFQGLYAVNQREPLLSLSPAMGRYPEDRYDGYETGRQGNPWFLLTTSMAEFYYHFALRRCEQSLQEEGGDHRLDASLLVLRDKGDRFLKRVQGHLCPGGSMSEQLNAHTGFCQGAADLSWSYASFLNSFMARSRLQSCLEKIR